MGTAAAGDGDDHGIGLVVGDRSSWLLKGALSGAKLHLHHGSNWVTLADAAATKKTALLCVALP